MSYCVVSDITSEFKSIDFTASNAAVSSAEVAEFILQEERALDSRVAGIYEVPITGSVAISVMKLMNTLMVKARIHDILYIKTGRENSEQGNTAVELRDRVDDMIKQIHDGTLILIDATVANSSAGASSYTNTNSIDPVFTKGSNQW